MEAKEQTILDIRSNIIKNNPNIIFISGKTCTGKSTFARSLQKYGYNHIELDFIVRDSVLNKFKTKENSEAFKVYKGIAPTDWQNSFELAANRYILQESKKSKIIVDAAIADPKVLKRIFVGNLSEFMFIYLHPFDNIFYYKCIYDRFMNDYKIKFRSFPLWDKISPEILEDFINNGQKSEKFMKIVRDYGDSSINVSIDRYSKFKKIYPNIILTGH